MEPPTSDDIDVKGILSLDIDKYESLLQWMESVENGCSELERPVRQNNSEKAERTATNRLGGQYSTGRPLPMEIRESIVEMARVGLKPCQISKELRVSHGCVSKLLAKWRKTGTIKPEKIGGSRPKKVLPTVAKAITVYKMWRPRLQSWQIKECLIRDGICTQHNVPSVSSINKTLRNQRRVKIEVDDEVGEVPQIVLLNGTSELVAVNSKSSSEAIMRKDDTKVERVATPSFILDSWSHAVLPIVSEEPTVQISTSSELTIFGCNQTHKEEILSEVVNVKSVDVNAFDDFDLFSSTSSSTDDSAYGSASLGDSSPTTCDFDDLLAFLDDVFVE